MSHQQFVTWFRQVSPYVHAHRGRTFVICLTGEAIASAQFSDLCHDIALLHSLGIQVVLVCGIRPQIEKLLTLRGETSYYAEGIRITNEVAMQCVKAACGEVLVRTQRFLSTGLANSPLANVTVQTITGNFVTARPLGIRHGHDYLFSGEVRSIDAKRIQQQLDLGNIVFVPPVGYSPTGEAFNLLSEHLAAELAIALHANKWICMTESSGLYDTNQQLIRQMTLLEANQLCASQATDSLLRQQLNQAIHACEKGVERVHILSHEYDGSLLLELFSHDGIGTLISTDPFESLRQATIFDVGGLLELLRSLEEAGILVRRSREKLEIEIDHFTVQERDGLIIACAALYPFPEEQLAELACLAVHQDYRADARGDVLLQYLEKSALRQGINKLFVLTTRTSHWFRERGFQPAPLDSLPVARREMYNLQRNSQVLLKIIEP